MAKKNAKTEELSMDATPDQEEINTNTNDAGVDVKPTPDKVKRVTKEEFGSVGDTSAEIYPFKVAVPEGFDFKVHANLKKKDFISDHLYFEFRAAGAEFAAVTYRELAEEAKKMGSSKDRAKAKRFVKMTSKMEELKQQLRAAGVDVDGLLSAAKNDTDD